MWNLRSLGFAVILLESTACVQAPRHDSAASEPLESTRTYDMAAYDSGLARRVKDHALAAAYQMEAGELKGDDPEFFFYAAPMFILAGDYNQAFVALHAAVDAGFVDVKKLLVHPDLELLRTRPEWSRLIAEATSKEETYARTLTAPALREELLDMWARDQEARVTWLATVRKKKVELDVPWESPLLAEYWKIVEEVDVANTKRVREIVSNHVWPSIPDVGRDGAFAAWALVQHSDDVAFQESCLAAMKQALARKLDPAQYAELHDRIKRNQRLRQVYAMAVVDNGAESAFFPIEDEARVDERRRALGLEPAAVHARLHGFVYRRPSPSEATANDARDRREASRLIDNAERAARESNAAEARESFENAMALGIVGNDELLAAASRFASIPRDAQARCDVVFRWLRILRDRGALQEEVLLREPSFEDLHADPRWNELLADL